MAEVLEVLRVLLVNAVVEHDGYPVLHSHD